MVANSLRLDEVLTPVSFHLLLMYLESTQTLVVPGTLE